MSKTAHIVAICGSSIGELGFGITNRLATITRVLEEGVVWIGPRPLLEENLGFVQPIPYIVIRDGDKVLAYERGKGGGDARLHAKVSIGFGGHVDLADAVTDEAGVIDLRRTMVKACVRELEEELGIDLSALMPEQRDALCSWTHVISSDASPVDEVHIGLVATIDISDLPGIDPAKFEDVIENARWRYASDLVADQKDGIVTLESWTSLVLSLPFQVSA
ncbi:NUDIX domain-containing protein [Sphingomonas sp. ACRSK]|uniref:NUDIX domain-containing protein n=1 Tax=Sphingomonas sp. ACRSK TaxID=2918213 RepID=UPI001EF51C40|nr:NUDIX domain-containing protein [Sphingomonas sp. ACRSK]MCG7348883.1 NUDIX domain-containing protein [Sphingomonas sp. ACRSK]